MNADKESLMHTVIRVNHRDAPEGKSIYAADSPEVLFDAPEIGIRLERRGEYIHAYLDSPEAIKLAPHFLPDEGLVRRDKTEGSKEIRVYRVAGGGLS